jgi:hypothetical protein
MEEVEEFGGWGMRIVDIRTRSLVSISESVLKNGVRKISKEFTKL